MGIALAVRANSPEPPVVVERVVTEYLPLEQPAGDLSLLAPDPTASSLAEPEPVPRALTTVDEMISSEIEPPTTPQR